MFNNKLFWSFPIQEKSDKHKQYTQYKMFNLSNINNTQVMFKYCYNPIEIFSNIIKGMLKSWKTRYNLKDLQGFAP